MKQHLTRWLPILLVLGIGLAAWGLQATWVYWDQGPPDSDEWHQLVKSYGYWVGWHNRGLEGLAYSMRLTQTTFPPLVHLAAVPWYEWGGGFSTDLATLSHGPFLVLLALACYGMARRVAGPGAGLVAAVMGTSAPMIVCLSHKFLLDLPLAALVAASLWALLASRGLQRPMLAWLAGIAFGLALLAKFIAGVYLLGAFAWLMLPAVWDASRRWPKRAAWAASAAALLLGLALILQHAQLSTWLTEFPEADPPFLAWVTRSTVPLTLGWWWHGLGVASLGLVWAAWRTEHPALRALLAGTAALLAASWLAGCWYLPHLPRVIKGVAGFTAEGGAGEGDPTAGNLAGWTYYAWVLGHSLPRGWYHLFWVGLGACLLHRDLRQKAGPLVGATLFAYLLITLSTNKESRYTLALLPTVVVLAVVWTRLLPPLLRHPVRVGLAASAIILSTGWLAVAAGWWAPPPQQIWHDDRIASSAVHTPMDHTFPSVFQPSRILLPPPFYAVTPLPRTMPYEDSELPFRNFGP